MSGEKFVKVPGYGYLFTMSPSINYQLSSTDS